jgi:hypothetical protein
MVVKPSRTGAPRPAEDVGVESNARLTGTTAVILLVLLAIEGVTILGVRSHLTLHVFVGMLLIPPVLVKIGSTTWRFYRYYTGTPAYRKKGPPHPILRLLGPVVVVLTVILFASGVLLILTPGALGGQLLFFHKASFVLWFGAMTVHVVGHAVETARLAPLDYGRRTRAEVGGASTRQWMLAASLVAGALLGVVMLNPTTTYQTNHPAIKHRDGIQAPARGRPATLAQSLPSPNPLLPEPSR